MCHPNQHQQKSHFTPQLHSLPSITSNLFSSTITIMPSTKHVTKWKIQQYMPYSHQVLCLPCQESCLTPQLLWQHLSKNDSCCTSWLNSSNSGTLLTVLRSLKSTKKLPEPNGVNSVPSKVMMMMTMATISTMTNHPSTISTLLMKVMTPFLILPTTIITSMTTCHQISFAKMKRWIPHLKGKVDMTKKPIPPPHNPN